MFKKLSKYVKSNKKEITIFTLLIFFFLIGIPIVIAWLFSPDTFPNHKIITNFSAEDILQYYGSILAFLGTVLLGALALYQNHLIKLENDDRFEQKMRNQRINLLPKVNIRMIDQNTITLIFSKSIYELDFKVHYLKINDKYVDFEPQTSSTKKELCRLGIPNNLPTNICNYEINFSLALDMSKTNYHLFYKANPPSYNKPYDVYYIVEDSLAGRIEYHSD